MQVFNFSIKNATKNELDIYIDGSIVDAETQNWLSYWGETLSQSYKSLRDQVNQSDASVINIYINSGGGNVAEAMAMHDFIVELQSKGKTVNTFGRGIVASAATYILMASNNSEMSENSWFMIHNVSGAAYGDLSEIENYAATLRKFNNQIRDFYANATGLTTDEITTMMNAETWMTAKDAKAKGFTKNVSAKVDFTNSIDKKQWMFKNMEVLQAYNSSVAVNEPPTQQSFFNQLEEKIMKFFTNAFKKIKDAETPENKAIVDAVEKAFEDAEAQIEPMVTNMVKKELKNAAEEEDANDNSEDEIEETEGTETTSKKVVKPAKEAEGEKPADDSKDDTAATENAKALALAMKEIKALKNDVTRLKGGQGHGNGNQGDDVEFGSLT